MTGSIEEKSKTVIARAKMKPEMLEKEMDKLRDKLIHGLQRKAIAKQFGLAIENDDVAQRERLA